MTQARASQTIIRCPRCGYDQRGVIASWVVSCPLEGHCTECGLNIRWAESICSHKFEPPWCVEFALPIRSLLLSFPRTLLHSFRPVLYWKRLLMTFEVRVGRLAAYAVFLTGVPAILFAIMQTSIALHVRERITKEIMVINWMAPTNLARIKANVPRVLPPQITDAVPSLRIANEVMERQSYERRVKFYEDLVAQPIELLDSAVVDVLDAVFRPMSEQSSNGVLYPDFVTMYPPPDSLHHRIVHDRYWGGYLPPSALGPQAMVDVCSFGWKLAIVMPLTLLLLPVTLRSCRVRKRHLLRVAIYGLWIPAVILTINVLLVACGLYSLNAVWTLQPLIEWLPQILFGMVVVWWYAAIRHYLKLPHALAVTALMSVLCLLLVIAATYYGNLALAAMES